MNKREAIEATKQVAKQRNCKWETGEAYSVVVGKYCDFLRANPGKYIDDYLSTLAEQNYSGSTQHGELCALVFFYKRVLKKKVGKLNYRQASKHVKAIDYLTHAECHRLFGQMSGITQLQAQLMYGTGLRVGELLALRIKDLGFDTNTITVRDGKGGNHRTVPMPKSLKAQIEEQKEKAKYYWQVDRDRNNPPPYLPDPLLKKIGGQAKDFTWFWLFPASNLSKDKESGIVRRHPLTASGIRKALGIAAKRAGIEKRVHPHVMRHSFATQCLLNGMDIKNLATLMGHKSTATTQRYLHCIPDFAFRAVSPLDSEPGGIIPFPVHGSCSENNFQSVYDLRQATDFVRRSKLT